jgi:D-alanyl-D-alanine carboxypeptidase
MRSSSLPITTKMPRPFMHGYDVEPGKKPEDVSELINPAGAWASGGIVSTPLDMARFARHYVPAVLATATVEGPFRLGSSSPPGPGKNFAGLGLFRYRTGCGTVYGHTGSFPGYRVLLAASADGERSVVFVASAQIVPGQGSQKVAKAITKVQARAVCRALD